MKNVFIVTQGEYSDYHICGVFDKKELAEQFISAFEDDRGYGDKMEIEEWNLNPHEFELCSGLKPYFVRMDINGNSIEPVEIGGTYGFSGVDRYGFDIHKNLCNHCFAKDPKHAIKITNELRTRLIAEDKWVSTFKKQEGK